ncbi:DUF2490 domain-containing protein [Pontiella agarivorans]|uniref:DUF2490 domain-containing protein n=1 Tax=Pontiella agarivorans TaxID=3038953 RepID=A0ABU5MYU7_9BACT|nr:DUF2490 domain-containing protein [Pontiella agarivorans]MDZ8119360.1 DUF2490 domain-containing protein [Pontiella agarivorans]
MKVRLTAALLGAAMSTLAWDSAENAVWLEGTLKGKLTEKLSLSLKEQVRYRENDGFFYWRYTDVGVGWKFSNAWNLTGNYRYITTRKRDGDWFAKPMLHANLTNTLPLDFLRLKSRMRLAHVDMPDGDDQALLWPRITLSFSKGWKGLNPYGAWEPIYDMADNLVYCNRFEGGFLYAPLDNLFLKAFLMHQLNRTDSTSKWTESYNMGIGATLKF